jgi:hypothetical protein
MEERLGIKFPDELVAYMKDKHQDNAGTLAKDKWHCFDIPFVLACENREMAAIIYDHLKPFTDDMKDQLGISIQGKNKCAVHDEIDGRKRMDEQDSKKAMKEAL